jgi:predicted phosphodiesterase
MNKVYAISDIHGMYNLWRQVIDSLDETDTLYVLGDCGDRGPDGWKIIKEALTDPRVVYIRGNHDEMLLDCWKSEWHDNYLWFCNGGYETFNAVIAEEKLEIYLMQLARTKLYHCYENKEGQKIHLSHAGFSLLENDEIPNSEDLLWDRDHIDDRCDWWPEENPNDYVVHGHTYCASKSCFAWVDTELNDSHSVGRYCYGHKICIDGRSFLTNKIAMLNLDTLQETIFEITD